MGRINPLKAREVAILKRNLHACYSRVPTNTDFFRAFFHSIMFAHGVPWSKLRARLVTRGRANQSMWAEWRAFDRFQKLVAQLERYDRLHPVRMAYHHTDSQSIFCVPIGSAGHGSACLAGFLISRGAPVRRFARSRSTCMDGKCAHRPIGSQSASCR